MTADSSGIGSYLPMVGKVVVAITAVSLTSIAIRIAVVAFKFIFETAALSSILYLAGRSVIELLNNADKSQESQKTPAKVGKCALASIIITALAYGFHWPYSCAVGASTVLTIQQFLPKKFFQNLKAQADGLFQS